jgi:CRISPR/Cas system endoribonuclease Cas6 (RAMP superfamily)
VIESSYRFFVVIDDPSGAILYREEAQDFLPCYEDLLFSAIAARKIANDGKLPRATVEPVWADAATRQVAGAQVTLPPLSKRYGLAIFTGKVGTVLREIEGERARARIRRCQVKLAC